MNTPNPTSTLTPAAILRREHVEIICTECGDRFILEFPTLAKYVTVCPTCSETKVKEAYKADARKAWSRTIDAGGWERHCPVAFRNTTRDKLPLPSKLDAVLGWRYGPQGLVLCGPTGFGKTRCLYELLKREFKAGHTIAIMDHGSALNFAALYSGDSSPDVARRWIEHRCTVDILAMDDLFKAKQTDSYEQAIFTIVAQRTERERPILITTNDVGDSLLKRMSADRGPALVKRFRDFCTCVSFS